MGNTAALVLVAFRVAIMNTHQDQSQGPIYRISSALIYVVWVCPVFPTCKGYLLIDWDQEALEHDHGDSWGNLAISWRKGLVYIAKKKKKKNYFASHLIRCKQYSCTCTCT